MDRETEPEAEETGTTAPVGHQEQVAESFALVARPAAQTRRAAMTQPDAAQQPGGITGPPDTTGSADATRPAARTRLTEDPRLPLWGLRVVLAAIAGIAVTLWQDWRLGLTAAVVVAIADTIYRSKTMSVIPADARVSSAQRRTRRRLVPLRMGGYVALHRRAIPGSTAVIDHLVIGPGGVFAVDSERWDRRLPVRTVGGTMLYHGPLNQKNRLMHARWEAAQASRLLGAELGWELPVQPAMVIYGPTIPWTVASLRGVDVFAGRRVGKYFRRRTRLRRKSRLDVRQVEAIEQAASRALPPS